MATIFKAPSMHDRMYVGAHGNTSTVFTKAELADAAVGDTVEMIQVEVGISLIGLRVNTNGLGAGVTLDIKVGDTLLAGDVDVASAQNQVIPTDTVYTKSKQVLSATIKGASATGTLEINPEYVVKGY
ncbi:hypothetical protein [Grimontia marina]|uniref:Uncharacterized protein n=1 Tax=Grimontia marina TaxID=646534 RepID=A0A128EYR6_9GAMM|nr:hypothetical protein [Grimontia marina]CZF79719.1 hypothetical protein GMA8713_01101 [Grimontia marina]